MLSFLPVNMVFVTRITLSHNKLKSEYLHQNLSAVCILNTTVYKAVFIPIGDEAEHHQHYWIERHEWDSFKTEILFTSSRLRHPFMFRSTRDDLLFFDPISAVPPGIANLINLEILNLSNNHLEELPLSLSSMPKLRILNCSINRLNTLPRGFGAFPVLEVLDLSYNNLNEKILPGNFFMMGKIK